MWRASADELITRWLVEKASMMVNCRSLPNSWLPRFATPPVAAMQQAARRVITCRNRSSRPPPRSIAVCRGEHRARTFHVPSACSAPRGEPSRRTSRKKEQDVASDPRPRLSCVPRREDHAVAGPARPAETVLPLGRPASSPASSWCKLWFDRRCFVLGVTSVAVEREESVALSLREASRKVSGKQPCSRSAS